MSEKFTIVIPTMWKYDPFIDFLDDLVKFPLVDEIILVDNDNTETPIHPVLKNEKVKLFSYGRNTYVNPVWNFGVNNSTNDKVCILNDDIIFDLKLFYKIGEFLDNPNTGVVGVCPGHEEHGQPPFVNGSIHIKPWSGEHTLGFGCLMFVNKNNWVDIPDQLKVYCGDNWIFDTALERKKTNYIITDLLHHTPYATTTGGIVNDFLQKEIDLYARLIHQYRIALMIQDRLFNEYMIAYNTKSDINEHLPMLNELAKECKHITEFGVSDGCSTRAFLIEDAVLRSYDIKPNDTVTELFGIAQARGKNVQYIIQDVLTAQVEETDLLFIDTWHSYRQLKQELKIHGNIARKYMVFHDTQTFGTTDEGGEGKIGLLPAIIEFLIEHPEWKFKFHRTNNNGLTVLERVA